MNSNEYFLLEFKKKISKNEKMGNEFGISKRIVVMVCRVWTVYRSKNFQIEILNHQQWNCLCWKQFLPHRLANEAWIDRKNLELKKIPKK